MDGRAPVRERAAGETIEYPTRDGKPMGETDDHADALRDYAVNVLRHEARDDSQTYVSGNNFVYYTEGVKEDCVSPDCYVVRGVPKRPRDTFKVWQEGGRTPCFVLEITSKSTRNEDLGGKMAKYRDDLQVPDYFLFDPRAEWVRERLRGYRLENGVYQPIATAPSGRLLSPELGLELGVEGSHLRFYRPGAAEPLPTNEERALKSEERAERERDRAERESERAERESERAERESERAANAEGEASKLREEIERLRRAPRDGERGGD